MRDDGGSRIVRNCVTSFMDDPKVFTRKNIHLPSELIKKWADGAKIQWKSHYDDWIDI